MVLFYYLPDVKMNPSPIQRKKVKVSKRFKFELDLKLEKMTSTAVYLKVYNSTAIFIFGNKRKPKTIYIKDQSNIQTVP